MSTGQPTVVRIVCRLEAHDDVPIDELQQVPGVGWVGTAGRLPTVPSTLWQPERATAQYLDVDDRVALGEGSPDDVLAAMAGVPGADAVRTRYRFACPSCSLNVSARVETLVPILDTLIEHGADEVTLRTLGVLVEGHRTRRSTGPTRNR